VRNGPTFLIHDKRTQQQDLNFGVCRYEHVFSFFKLLNTPRHKHKLVTTGARCIQYDGKLSEYTSTWDDIFKIIGAYAETLVRFCCCHTEKLEPKRKVVI